MADIEQNMIDALWNKKPIVEADDYAYARAMVSELHATQPHLQMYYLALWAARFREHFVAIGREVQKQGD